MLDATPTSVADATPASVGDATPMDVPELPDVPEPVAEVEEKPKRKRGRPKKDATVPADVIPRKKGKKDEKTATLDADQLAKFYQFAHQGIAVVIPGYEIDETSARMVAETAVKAAEDFGIDLQLLGIANKWVSLGTFALTLGITEYFAFKRAKEILEARKKEEQKKQGEVTAMQKGVAAGAPLVAVQ